jgi:hypothetical protein
MLDRRLHLLAGPHGGRCRVERGDESIAERLHQCAAVSIDDALQGAQVALEHGGGDVVSQSQGQRGRVDDIRPHEGDQPGVGSWLQITCRAGGPRGVVFDTGAHLPGGHERRVVAEDPLFELAELRAGFDAQLVREVAPHLLVGAEGVGLPATAIQREHQLRPEPLVEGMGGRGVFQLRSRLACTAQLQQGVEPALQRLDVQGLETGRLVVRPADTGELSQRRSPPQRQCRLEHRQPARRVGLRAGRRHVPLEAVGIDLHEGDLEHIAARPGLEGHPVAAQQLAELGHVRLHGPRRTLTVAFAPQLGDEPVSAQRLPGVNHQAGEEPAPLSPAQRDGSRGPRDLKWAKDPKIHPATPCSDPKGPEKS